MQNIFYVKMDGEVCGPYTEEEMANVDIPADTPVVANDPEGFWHTYEWFNFQSGVNGDDSSNKKSFVSSSLLPNEKILCSAEWHWFNYLLPWFLIFFAVFYTLQNDLFDDFELVEVIIPISLIVVGISMFVEIASREFVVTTQRIFIKTGFFLLARASYELRLEKLESIQVYQGFFGRIFGFGLIAVHGVGASRQFAKWLSAPLEFRQHIFSELSKRDNLTLQS